MNRVFRVLTPHVEITEFLVKLAEKAGCKSDSYISHGVYFHVHADEYRIYDQPHYNLPGNDFVSLEKAVEFFKEGKISLPKIGKYDIIISHDNKTVEIGCQRIPKEKIKEVLDALN